jgi:outer membrane beta-barrel protein
MKNGLIKAGFFLLIAGLCSVPQNGWAQEDDIDALLGDDLEEDIVTESEEEDGSEEEEASDDAEAAPEKVAGEAKEDVQTIFVIQRKPILVAGAFELSPQFVQSVNSRFVDHTGFIFSGIYHIKENVAVEFAAGNLWSNDTDLTQELIQKEHLAPEYVKFYELTWLATADLQWSPIYGKLSIYDRVMGEFNLYMSVGAGLTGLRLENKRDDPGNYLIEDDTQLTATYGGGFRFYFTDWFGVRFEVRDYVQALAVYQDQTQTGESSYDVANTVLSQLGLSLIF